MLEYCILVFIRALSPLINSTKSRVCIDLCLGGHVCRRRGMRIKGQIMGCLYMVPCCPLSTSVYFCQLHSRGLQEAHRFLYHYATIACVMCQAHLMAKSPLQEPLRQSIICCQILLLLSRIEMSFLKLYVQHEGLPMQVMALVVNIGT